MFKATNLKVILPKCKKKKKKIRLTVHLRNDKLNKKVGGNIRRNTGLKKKRKDEKTYQKNLRNNENSSCQNLRTPTERGLNKPKI